MATAEKPRYLVTQKCYAQDVDGVPGNSIIKASPKDPRLVWWPPHIEPSRTFTPMNKAAVKQLARLFKKDKDRRTEAIEEARAEGTKPPSARLRWKPKPIPELTGTSAGDANQLELLQLQIAALEERISGTQKPGTTRSAAKDSDRLDADKEPTEGDDEAGLQPNAANDTPA